MTLRANRILGFAFASADLFIEIAADGQITYALGASEALSGESETELAGQAWRDFVAPGDRRTLAMLLGGLEPGRRAGPVILRLATPGRAVSLTALRLPQNGKAISCALTKARYDADVPENRLPERSAFEVMTRNLVESARPTGKELELALVELTGLTAARRGVPRASRNELEAQVAALLRSQTWGGQAATELPNDRFALVRARGESAEALSGRIERLAATITAQPISASTDVVSLTGVERPQHVFRALRYVLERFSEDGRDWGAPEDLSAVLSQALDKAFSDATALSTTISGKAFNLAYQPVVDLQSGALHHYEVLVRFGEDGSPFPKIRMAEELDLIESLDFAILEKAVAMIMASPELVLAVNVSGRTITSDRYIEQTLALLARNPGLCDRLMFELTESAAIGDLSQANARIQSLRRAGCEVCLDDFGSGAASFTYLQQLDLDVLKIDGRYIRDLGFGGRGVTFVKHLVQMCRELNMRTLAEMVETSSVEDEVRRIGVNLAQGWLYGLAADSPIAPSARNTWKP